MEPSDPPRQLHKDFGVETVKSLETLLSVLNVNGHAGTAFSRSPTSARPREAASNGETACPDMS